MSLFSISARVSAVVIAMYCVVAMYGEGVYRYHRWRDTTPGYNAVNLERRNLPPLTIVRLRDDGTTGQQDDRTAFYLLGTDNLGRPVWSRLVQGARIAFHVGVLTTALAIPL
ncbi:MAG: hypothetical protein FWF84_04045, partial [Kiritimatiellaeota bacterium]|nr:hypothetical protein [Kiritimatiellota bacterium]